MMRCDHPDIEDFIHAKRDGSLSNFNMTVAVTDAFMRAVRKRGGSSSGTPPSRSTSRPAASAPTAPGPIARRGRATLFDQIMQSTYSHAEPGVMFIDRVNQDNNLSYCETIARDQSLRRAAAAALSAAAASARST